MQGMPPIRLRAVVTAGGTREPIDDVRYVGNFSSGRFGAAIATALAENGVETTLLGSQEMLRHPELLDPRLELVSFSSFEDLDRELTQLIEAGPPDLLLMVAAVSDYTPVRQPGKIRSDADELVIRMTRNPKLLATLRDRCGPQSFLVGFKLLSHVPPERLIEVAREQVSRERLDLTVANDLRDLQAGRHPVTLVPASGDTVQFDGDKPEVALALVNWILDRLRGELREAASVCLYEPASQQILVGRRCHPPAADQWVFPGGRLEPGESHLEAAARELSEETGLQLPPGPALREMVLEANGYRITCFIFQTDRTPAPVETDELRAAWLSLEAARALELTPGTRAVLSSLTP